jgi:hypothetical protein
VTIFVFAVSPRFPAPSRFTAFCPGSPSLTSFPSRRTNFLLACWLFGGATGRCFWWGRFCVKYEISRLRENYKIAPRFARDTPSSKQNVAPFHAESRRIDTCLDWSINRWKPLMAGAYLLDGHPQCLSSRSLVQVPVPYMHQIPLLTWGQSYKDISSWP